MAKRSTSELQDAFDFGTDPASVEAAAGIGDGVPAETAVEGEPTNGTIVASAGSEVERSDWQEVPQPRYLSWTDAERLTYCMERDLDSAEHETSLEWCRFYIERADSYRLQLEVLLKQAPMDPK